MTWPRRTRPAVRSAVKPKIRSAGLVYVEASKPSKWLVAAPWIALVATLLGASITGWVSYDATTSASEDRTADGQADFLKQQRIAAYSKLLTDVNEYSTLLGTIQAFRVVPSEEVLDGILTTEARLLPIIKADVSVANVIGSATIRDQAASIDEQVSHLGQVLIQRRVDCLADGYPTQPPPQSGQDAGSTAVPTLTPPFADTTRQFCINATTYLGYVEASISASIQKISDTARSEVGG